MKETHNAPCNTGRVGLSLVVGGYTHTHTHTHTHGLAGSARLSISVVVRSFVSFALT